MTWYDLGVDETAKNINEKTGILLSRNTPVALVVGVAGFLGSHLAEDLLEKNIQVVGVDDFSSGKKQNLNQAIKNNKFHLINASADDFRFDPDRLDYIFIAASDNWDLGLVLDLAKQHGSKIVFLSTIDLYDRKKDEEYAWFKEAEGKIAKFASEHKLNARVVRLSVVFGPRMNFEFEDPVTHLISACLSGGLQKESVTLEFSSRALFIEDATALIVKSMLSGSTALKIFDGALLYPVKAVEIKQVLLDPLWYENKGFTPSELPPWPTPNLEKTIKELAWSAKADLVGSLKKTINYFKETEDGFPKLELPKIAISKMPEIQLEKIIPWVEEKVRGQGTGNRQQEKQNTENSKLITQNSELHNGGSRKLRIWRKTYLTLALLIIIYAFVYPLGALVFGVLTFRSQLNRASEHLVDGEFEKSRQSIAVAENGVEQARYFINSFEVLRKADILTDQFNASDRLIETAGLITSSAKHSVLGTEKLYEGLKTISGESTNNTGEVLIQAQTELNQAYEQAQRAQAEIGDPTLDILPEIVQIRIKNLKNHLDSYSLLLKKGQSAAQFLPQLVAVGGKKSYLVLLQNNNELRPTGGFIGSFAQINFENGKLQKIEVNDIYAIDGQLSLHVEPPKEIKEDLGQKDWYLRDSNWEPDFPTSARQSKWFYNKETSRQVDGVIALDVSALEDLLSVTGPLNVTDYDEEVGAHNLFERAITHAESGFFPGSQAKKNFITALTNQLFNKLFFVPNQNWPAILSSLGRSMDQKHILAYFDDPKLFSYLVSSGWAGTMPREVTDSKGVSTDFLAVVEANLGANKSNYYIERNYELATTIGKEGEIFNKLRIDYVNRSPSGAWPAGKYKNRLRIYLPFGAKLSRALWDDLEITSKVTTFADFGRTGYSMLLELDPKAHKALVLEYQLPRKLNFLQDEVLYRINIVKQPGTLTDRFDWRLSFPLNFNLIKGSTASNGLSPQEYQISTDLSQDRAFEVTFRR